MHGTGVNLIGVTTVAVPEADDAVNGVDDAFVPDDTTLVSVELAEVVFAVVVEDALLPAVVATKEAALVELTEVLKEVAALEEVDEEVFVERIFVEGVFVEEEDDCFGVLITRFSWLLLNSCSAVH